MPQNLPTPPPPYAEGTGLPWDVTVGDAVAAIAEARARHGDTFMVESGRDHYLFTFSPAGVESFYALPEEVASKGLADYLMLRRKLPDEIFDGRRTLPNSLFRRDDVASYLVNLEGALAQTVAELGSAGSVDLFDLTRRLGHRMGLASWAGPGAADGGAFERLVLAFDTLDGSDAFVHPDAMASVAASGKSAERAALNDIADVLETGVRQRDSGEQGGDLFGRIVEAWSSEPPDVRMRGISLDIALIHIASMSNLMAALGWAFVDLLDHPTELARVASGDTEFAQRCALESTRMAQRSIMSRAVLSPVDFDTGDVCYRVPAGWTISTLLPLLNTSAAPGLDRWDPDRWHRHRLADQTALPSPTLVTAFGHGRHSCPAQPFSLSAMTAAMTHLVCRYELTPRWANHPRPVPAQIGGVARAADACPIDYARIC
ncbi:MAG TPA: cytochrome [Mycobacterium sp.]|nr:cytochrome [Mycobacterium sp.]